MLKRIQKWFEETDTSETVVDEDRIQLALAALLVEMARADFDQQQSEDLEIAQMLGEHFELDEASATDLLVRAQRAADDAVSLHDFTRALHENLTREEKFCVVEMLWRVAYADGHLDRYEDGLVRKLSELLYIRHSDLVRIRNRVVDDRPGAG